MATVTVTIELSVDELTALRLDPEGYVREMRLAAAAVWYRQERLSQARAAEVAGLSRAEFLDALQRYGVSPFQTTADEIRAEVEGG